MKIDDWYWQAAEQIRQSTWDGVSLIPLKQHWAFPYVVEPAMTNETDTTEEDFERMWVETLKPWAYPYCNE